MPNRNSNAETEQKCVANAIRKLLVDRQPLGKSKDNIKHSWFGREFKTKSQQTTNSFYDAQPVPVSMAGIIFANITIPRPLSSRLSKPMPFMKSDVDSRTICVTENHQQQMLASPLPLLPPPSPLSSVAFIYHSSWPTHCHDLPKKYFYLFVVLRR